MDRSTSPVVILTPGFPANEQDSSCLPFVQQVVAALAALRGRDSVRVVAFQYPFSPGVYVWKGITVHALGGRNRGGLARLGTWLKALRVIALLHRKVRLRSVLCFWLGECAFVGRIASRLWQLPLRIWMQGQDARIGNRYARLVKPASSELMAISRFQRDVFKRNYHIESGHVIGNGIDPQQFPPLNEGRREVDILGVGSLSEVKNYADFIEVVDALRGKYPALKAEIIGDGDQRAELQEMLGKRGLQEHLSLRLHMPHREVLQRMSQSKVLLHPSAFEGNSGVLLEALYSGCEVVSRMAVDLETLPQSFHLCETKRDMETVISRRLGSPALPKRILVNAIEDSAEKVNKLL